MTKPPLTLKAMSAADEARAPPRLGLRVLAAVMLVELALLLSLMLGFAGVAWAGPAHADISVNLSDGYARIVLHFSDDVDANVRMANNILVVSFNQPVDVRVDQLDSSAAGYVSAARRDPDGKAIRMALSQRVRVNSMMAGERLFVDLLPDSWTGKPPGLPQDVVEELAKRARDAEKKLRELGAVAQQREAPLARVRVSLQPTFSRYVFELPDLISVSTERNNDGLRLVFESALKFDLADAKATLPPTIDAIDTAIDHQQTSVQFTFIGKVDIRSFREDDNYVIDVAPSGATRDQVVIPPAAAPEQAPEAAPARNAAVPRIEPPRTAPPQPAAIKPQDTSPPPAHASETRPTPPSETEPIAAQPPAAQPSAAQPSTQPSAAKLADAPRPTAQPPEPSGRAPSGPADAKPAQPAAVAGPPVKPPPERPAANPERAAGGEGDQVRRPRDPTAPVRVELRRQSDNLKLTFPFAAPTPAAVFRRGDTLWLVFDSGAGIDVSALTNDATRTIRGVSVTRSNGGQVVRIKLARPRLTSMSDDGPNWTVTIGDLVLDPSKPLAIVRNVVGVPRATASISFDNPNTLHRLADPEAGDTLYVVTALGPARGLPKTQSFVEFRALASIHGVVIQPIADDLIVEVGSDKVVVARPAGLTLSSGASSGRRAGVYRPQVFDAQLWGFDRQANFIQREDKLIADAAAAPETKRSQPRYDLARFYLAREMYPEAKGVLDLALSDERPTAEDATGLVMRAVANIMLDRTDEALKDLANPLVGNQHDAQLWRAFAYARQGKWAEARDGFRNLEATIGTLPLELQRVVLRASVQADIELRDYAGAAQILDEFDTLGVPHKLEPSIAVLKGRVAEGLGRKEDALADYRLAADSDDRPAAAQGRLRETVLRYQLGDLKPSDVIAELETLTTIWRGDDTELEALQLLARLYTQEGRYRDAFSVMRTALKAHPNSDRTRRIYDEAAATFNSLFLTGKGDAMPAIDALSLFYDFRELTPIGRRGDEMIRRLSDRLVSVDLLDQASELLQHQVDHRLQGAARAQVATRLAVIYLMNRKPDRALATLRETRTAELSNELRNERLLLEARALSDIGRRDLALEVTANVPGPEAIRLRSDILWAAKRWREAAEQIELLYGDRWRDWQPLTQPERADILRAGMGYALAEDRLGLDRFRGKYAAKMADSPDSHAFDVVTAPSHGNSAEFRAAARTIAATDTLDAFLRDMRARYPDTGPFVPASGSSALRPPAARPAATPASPVAGAPQTRATRVDPTSTGAIPPRIAKDPAIRALARR